MKAPISYPLMYLWMFAAMFSAIAAFTLPPFFLPQSVAVNHESPPAAPVIPPAHPVIPPAIASVSPKSQKNETGITILPRTDDDNTRAPQAPLAARETDAVNGHGISLGEAQAFSQLSARFATIAKMNPTLFQQLEPRAVFIEKDNKLSARLIAGPFENAREAAIICGILHLPDGIMCKPQAFEGDLIARQ